MPAGCRHRCRSVAWHQTNIQEGSNQKIFSPFPARLAFVFVTLRSSFVVRFLVGGKNTFARRKSIKLFVVGADGGGGGSGVERNRV